MPAVTVSNRDGLGNTSYYVNMWNERGNVRVTVYDETESMEIYDASDDDVLRDIEFGFYKFDARDIAKYVHELVESGQVSGRYI
jgi:hypothetical protein